MNPISWLYYTCLNLIYYRVERCHSLSLHGIKKLDNVSDSRLYVTNCFLATVGLKVVDEDRDIVPWYVPLSKCQKGWICIVKEYGYKVGLA